MYYLVKIRFEADQENGKIKKIREQHLIHAESGGAAEKSARARFGGGISPCYIESVKE